jgi:thiosulfate reductase cytochrome b subunit
VRLPGPDSYEDPERPLTANEQEMVRQNFWNSKIPYLILIIPAIITGFIMAGLFGLNGHTVASWSLVGLSYLALMKVLEAYKKIRFDLSLNKLRKETDG